MTLAETQQREDRLSEKPLTQEEKSKTYAIMDVLDESLIREELSGVGVDELVYEFNIGGKKVTGLTVYGSLAMGRLAIENMKDIEIVRAEPKVEESERGFKATCMVTYRSLKTGSSITFPGTKFQPRDVVNKEGKVVKENDPNAETIAEMKAMRNGLLKIFSPKKSAEFLNQFRSEGRIKRVSESEAAEALAKAEKRGGGNAKPVEEKTKPNESTGGGPAVAKTTNSAKIKRYFETSNKKSVQLSPNHPLYDEFVNFCANLKVDHPEIEYQFNRSKMLDGEEVISSVVFENVTAGSELAKTIDEMILSIANAIAEGN